MMNNAITLTNLHNLLDYDARRFTSGEIVLKKVLPQWIKQASSLKLKELLQKYLDIVLKHVELMEHFIAEEEIYSISLNNGIMLAFIDETNARLAACEDDEVRDAALLASVQAINHYKISTYGTGAAMANELEMEKVASILHEAEINEKQIDDRLSQLAAFEINKRAKAVVK